MRRRRAAIAAGAAIVALAAGGALLASRDDEDPVPAGASLAEGVVVKRVEKIRGHRFRDVPEIHVVGARRIAAAVRRIGPWRSPGQRRAEWALLRVTAMRARTEPSESEAVALGVHVSKGPGQVYLLRDMVREDPREAELTLAHELVHDLDDERFALGDKLAARFDDDRQAAGAVAEGGAVYVEGLYGHRHLDGPTVTRFLDDLEPRYGAGPTPLALLRDLPYVAGARYVDRAYRRGGWAAVDAELHAPPRTTAEVLHPGRRARFERVPAPPGATLGARWRRLATLDFGELHTIALLVRSEGLSSARRLASAWRGGRAAVWMDRSRYTAAVIAWTLSDPAAARRLAAALGDAPTARRGRRLAVAFVPGRVRALRLARAALAR